MNPTSRPPQHTLPPTFHDPTSQQPHYFQPGEISLFSSTQRFFTSHPFTAPLLSSQARVCIHLPSSLHPKRSTEDSLVATTLHHPDRVAHCLALHAPCAPTDEGLSEVLVLFALGTGLNGHACTLHGGVTAALFDEAMGIMLTLDADRRHVRLVGMGKAEGEISEDGVGLFTRRLGVEYRVAVQTPGVVVVRVWKVGTGSRGQGKGSVLGAEMRQWVRHEGKGGSRGDGMGWAYGMGEGGEKVVATAEAEFRTPRGSRL